MSRSGYDNYMDYDLALGRWRAQVASAIRGKRGQTFLKDLLAALDAMPEKRLIANELEADGEVCAIGALGRARGIDMSKIDPEDYDAVATVFGIAHQLAQEVVYVNDEHFDWKYEGSRRFEYSPEERWAGVRKWVASKIARD